MNMPTISLILCTCNRSDCIKRLLNCLLKYDINFDKIIIVDSSNGNETKKVADSFKCLNLEYYRTERGLVAQRNFGLDKANEDIIGFFDDDVVPEKYFIENLRLAFKQTGAGCIVPYVYENNGKDIPGITGIIFKIASNLWGREFITKVAKRNYMPDQPFEGYIKNAIVSGCAFFCRKEVYEYFRFSDWMQGYSFLEDYDFGLKVSQKYEIIGAGNIRVHHYCEPSARDPKLSLSKMKVYNIMRIVSQDYFNSGLLLRLLVLHRMHLATVYEALVFVYKFRPIAAINTLYGCCIGSIRSFRFFFYK